MYGHGKPVCISGTCSDWPARTAWQAFTVQRVTLQSARITQLESMGGGPRETLPPPLNCLMLHHLHSRLSICSLYPHTITSVAT